MAKTTNKTECETVATPSNVASKPKISWSAFLTTKGTSTLPLNDPLLAKYKTLDQIRKESGLPLSHEAMRMRMRRLVKLGLVDKKTAASYVNRSNGRSQVQRVTVYAIVGEA